ncbi:ETC complex I subunit conserved region-domain-containing protein [Phascolomyces articulosus]|uniref:ETC complex I subunit conserved region-domain-containing protein n=1 Tax=Phascolomyces articulosus TaxID=60185 RepID=A0AAD5K542_9FUNG|nr:ETC complex I subunit conserved region-domain-containing protein [Phascolomyces articulosus]
MFFTRPLLQTAKKATTGLTGIPVHPNPRPHLIQTYSKTLEALSRLPTHAVYRQATESLTQQRLSVVQGNEDVTKIESLINNGQIEELIIQAEDELKLIAKMEEWKPWEQLEVPIPKGQWQYKSE